MTKYWFWFNTTFACGAVICDENGIVIDSCPIYKWSHGKHFRVIEKYYKQKNQLISYKLFHKDL
jgi:hypothetical protein